MRHTVLFTILLTVLVLALSGVQILAYTSILEVNAAQSVHISRFQPEMSGQELADANFGTAPYIHSRGVQGVRCDMLLRFDIGNIKEVPTKAVLRLYRIPPVYDDSRNTGVNRISVYPLLTDFDESKVTWNLFYKQDNQLFGRKISTTSVEQKDGWYEWDIPAALIQQWIDDPSSNKGLILISELDRDPMTNTFFSSSRGAFPPQLVVYLTGPSIVQTQSDDGKVTETKYVYPPIETSVDMKNKALAINFSSPDSGFSIKSIKDLRKNREQLIAAEKRPAVWRLVFKEISTGKELVVDSPGAAKYRTETAEEDGWKLLECNWTGVPVGPDGDCNIKVTVRLDKDDPDTRWQIEVDNHSKTYSLWYVDYPVIGGLGERKVSDVLNLWAAVGCWRTRYDGQVMDYDMVGGMWPMQFFALSNNGAGIYLSTNDPKQVQKRIHFDIGKEFYFKHYPEAMALPAMTYTMPYEVQIKTFAGDWYEAAKIHRKWALDQPWTARGPIKYRRSGGAQVSQAVYDPMLWLKDNRTANDSLAKDVVRLRNYFGVPIGLHLYCWHNCGFDQDYPNYLPIPDVDKFTIAVKAMQKAGVTVMPYINAELWNRTVPSFEPARNDSVRNADGSIMTAGYGGYDFSVVSPSSKVLKNRLANVARELAKCGIKAIYLDLMAATPALLDFSTSNGHMTGGAGGWWVDGYRDMVNGLREASRKEGTEMAFVTECATDGYMDSVNGFLTWWTRDDGAVPVLQAVYSGYTVYIGEGVYQQEDHTHFCLRTARDFIWGTALGWCSDSGTDVADYTKMINTPKGEFLRTLLRYRWAAREYLVNGEMLRELKNLSPRVEITGKNKYGSTTLPAIINSVWKAPDGTSAVVIVNVDTKPHEVSFNSEIAALGLAPSRSGCIMKQLNVNGKTTGKTRLKDRFIYKGTMKAHEVRVLVVGS